MTIGDGVTKDVACGDDVVKRLEVPIMTRLQLRKFLQIELNTTTTTRVIKKIRRKGKVRQGDKMEEVR